MFALTHGRVDEQEAFDDEQLETLVVMLDGALPILGRLPTTRRLELVRRHPRLLEQNTCALAPLAQTVKVKHGLVQPTLHLQYGPAIA